MTESYTQTLVLSGKDLEDLDAFCAKHRLQRYNALSIIIETVLKADQVGLLVLDIKTTPAGFEINLNLGPNVRMLHDNAE